MAKFAACNAGTKVKLTDGNGIVLDAVGKVVVAFGHGSNEDGNAFVVVQAMNIVADTYDFRVEAQRDLTAVGWEVVCDGIFDDLDELLIGRSRANLMSMEQLDHQTCESFECPRDSDRWTDLD